MMQRLSGLTMAAMVIVVLVNAPTLAQSPSPSPSPSAVDHETLGVTWPNEPTDTRLELARTTLQPGASIPATRFDGSWLARIESGTLTVSIIDGPAWIQGFEGSEDEPIENSTGVRLEAGQLLSFGPDSVLAWENRGTDPVSVLTAAIVDENHESMVTVNPMATPRPTPRGEAVNRIVLTGRRTTGDQYRITVVDHSGRVIGARVPSKGELRFADSRAELPLGQVAVGPVAFIRPGVHDILLRWPGAPCGPVARVDVAADLSAIDVRDRAIRCDTIGTSHWLVLRVRGQAPNPDDIEGRVKRQR